MKRRCPYLNCKSRALSSLRLQLQVSKPDSVVHVGTYRRSTDSKRIQRFLCPHCRRTFSPTSHLMSRYQKKRRINTSLYRLLCSGVSQRRAALILGVNRKTIIRRFRYLAKLARLRHERDLALIPKHSIHAVQFDDLESSIHSKCKPVSVALSVRPENRKIITYEVSVMPAKGHLAGIARTRYGYRPDLRPKGWRQFFQTMLPLVHPKASFTSDENPHYPRPLRKMFPEAQHVRVKGQRGCVAGQGELKKIGFDPLFSLNHTCAMMRANMNRLFRRTWCTSKTIQGLKDHLALYVDFHNRVLIQQQS